MEMVSGDLFSQPATPRQMERHEEDKLTNREKFEAFLLAQPKAYPLFCKIVKEMQAMGHKHLSADFICHILRYRTMIDGRGEDEYKINNTHVRFMREKWDADHPDQVGFFLSREAKTA